MPRETMLDNLVEEIAAAILAKMDGGARATGTRGRGNGRRKSPMRGKHFSAAKMRCRYPGCKNRSKGPKFSWLCEDHLKLGKRAVKAAIEKAEKRA
jgi:hypothetical protein